MNGRHDLCAPEVAEFYASLLPDARREVFEDSSHYPHIEEPERHERVINSFLCEADLAPSRLS
jgi:L-proline amide hydrolase